MTTTREYTVRLEAFEGPLDLLLYLIRRAEVHIADIPIATITEQYLGYLGEVDRIDIDRAGEFLLMAATLIEIKSRLLAPRPKRAEGAEGDEGEANSPQPEEDPRAGLVAQLLAYKRYRDAADTLEERFDEWQARYPAGKAAIDTRSLRDAMDAEDELDLEDVSIIDLVEAFNRIADTVNFERLGEHEVYDDDTPIELHAEDLVDQLERAGARGEAKFAMRAIFEGRKRLEMIGLFLAMLELVRQRRLMVRQAEDGEIAVGLRVGDEAEAEV